MGNRPAFLNDPEFQGRANQAPAPGIPFDPGAAAADATQMQKPEELPEVKGGIIDAAGHAFMDSPIPELARGAYELFKKNEAESDALQIMRDMLTGVGQIALDPGMVPSRMQDADYGTLQDIFDKSREAGMWKADPEFNVYQRMKDEDLLDAYPYLMESASENEYAYRKQLLDGHKTGQRLAQEFPVTYGLTRFASEMMAPANMVAMRAGLSWRGAAATTGAAVAEQTGMIASQGAFYDRDSGTAYIQDTALFSAAFAGLLTATRLAKGGLGAFSSRLPSSGTAMGARAAVIDAEIAAAKNGTRAHTDPEGVLNAGERAAEYAAEGAPRARSMGAAAMDDAEGAARPNGPNNSFIKKTYDNFLKDTMGVAEHGSFINPILRMGGAKARASRQFIEDMLEIPLILNKNSKREATVIPIETDLKIGRKTLFKSMEDINTLYRKYLDDAGTGKASQTRAQYLGGGARAADGREMMSFRQFREAITRSMRTGEATGINHVDSATSMMRRMYDDIVEDALGIGYFTEKQRRELNFTSNPDRQRELLEEIQSVEDKIRANKGKFVNRMWDKDKIREKQDQFLSMLLSKGFTQAEAMKFMDDRINGAVFDDSVMQPVGKARSGQARVIEADLDDSEFDQFLENDIFNLSSFYFRTMSPDIALFKRFGSWNLEDDAVDGLSPGPIAMIGQEYQAKIAAAREAGEADDVIQLLAKEMEDQVSDARAVRDLIRGTYAIPKNPQSLTSRGIRISKHFAAMTMLTGALAQLPDVARVVTANGLKKSMGSLFEILQSDLNLYKLGKNEARMAGQAFEVMAGVRAAQLADLGDLYGFGSRSERFVSQVSGLNFLVNGISYWNDFAKTTSSIVVGTKILGAIEDVALGRATPKVAEQLAASYIDESMARRIYQQQGKWERTEANIFAQSETWDDAEAARHFHAAITRDVDKVIVTPGLGDRPLWMSNEYGSLIAQFKSFTFGAHMRALLPALQERDANIAVQVAAMVGVGMMISSFRTDQLGMPQEDLDSLLVDGIDRSGILGPIMDINNIAERVTGNMVGVRALTDGQRGAPDPLKAAAAILGPVASMALKGGQVAYDVTAGDYGYDTARNIRSLQPTNKVAHLNWIWSRIQDGLAPERE